VTTPVILPPLQWRATPNTSSRHGTRPNLVVIHETAGSYLGAVSWLCNPASDTSATFVLREDGLHAHQLARIQDKPWTQCAFNSRAVSIELANITAKGFTTEHQLRVAARITSWLCWKLTIPPRWSRHGATPGVTYHGDLGSLGCSHPYCGPDSEGWTRFLAYLGHEMERGDWRPRWARL
jgi:N-acetylmuramoyl-L-alanine amidase-like protein